VPVIDATFFPVIVTDRPADVTGLTFQQPPAGTDPGALRIVPAQDVRSGDWVLGDCEQHTRARRGMRWGGHSVAAFSALPILDQSAGTVALDGETPNWNADELIMIIPREHIPAATYAVWDRVERTVLHTPDVWDNRSLGRTRAVIQRGTVTAVDPDGLISVDWDGNWLDCVIPDSGIRRVDHVRVERERTVYGYAAGDRVTSQFGATGVVMETWRHWYDGTPMARIFWRGSGCDNSPGRHEVTRADRYSRAAVAA
jgi:hypothetical protein